MVAAHPALEVLQGAAINELAAAQDGGVAILPNQTQTLYAHAEPADVLSLVTSLDNATGYATGQAFAQVEIHATNGAVQRRTLTVGIDSAVWNYERTEIKADLKHRRAELFDTLPRQDTPANRYWTRIPLNAAAIIDRVTIANLTPEVTIYLSRASLYGSASPEVQLLTPRLPGWRKVYDFDHAQIYENPRFMPRVWLTDQVRAVTPNEALRAIRGETPFDPRTETLLESAAVMLTQRFTQPPQAHIKNYSANHLTIETNADAPSLLNVSERYAPGWTATLDGKPTKIYQANYLLRGVALPAGQHRVEMRYTASAARRGWWISLATGLAFCGVLAFARKKNLGSG